jgi:hypothetical protein
MYLALNRVVKTTEEKKKPIKKEKHVQKAHSLSVSFFFLCVYGDDKKMEKLFSSVPPNNIEIQLLQRYS